MLRAAIDMGRPATQVRSKILDAALTVLKEHGERALTQTRVAREAGIPQGHLTYYFPKKSDLLLGVTQHFANVNSQDIQTFFGARAGQPMADTLRAYVCRLSTDRSRTRMLLGLLVISDSEPQLAELIRQNAKALRALLAGSLERSLDDPLVDLMLAILWGLGIHQFVLRTEHTEALVERALALLQKPSPKEESPSPKA